MAVGRGATRTVTARRGAAVRHGTAQNCVPSGKVKPSCGLLKHVVGSGLRAQVGL